MMFRPKYPVFALSSRISVALSALNIPAFACFRPEARLPYVYWERTGFEPRPDKSFIMRGDAVITVYCCASTYDEVLRMADNVTAALNERLEFVDLVPGPEMQTADAFVQQLTLTVRV